MSDEIDYTVNTETGCGFHPAGAIETVALTFCGKGGIRVTICWDCIERMKAQIADVVKVSQ